MLKLIRCDERLIHGQCMQFIVSDYAIKRIIVVDDLTASNPILKSIFTTAVPKSIVANVYSINESISEISASLSDNTNTLLLMKNPRTLVELRKLVTGLSNELNIGPQMAKNGVKCTEYSTLHPEDIEACKNLIVDGVRIYFNATGAMGSTTEWKSVIKD